MSDFKIKVTADLDASQVEAKIKALEERFKNYSIKTNVNLNGNGVNNLNSRLQQIQDNANGIARSFRGIAATKIKVDALNFLKNQTESAIQSVTDLNKAMTLVSMTMSNMSSSSLNSLKEQSLSLAKDLSTYTKTVTDAVTIYANENESAASMLAKAQPTSTVISDMEDGVLKTTEVIQNKAEAQARLNQMEEANKQAQTEGKDDIYNTTAIEAARQEVEKYQAQIDGLKESMEYFSEHSITEDQAKQAKTATDEIKSMKQEYDSLMKEANDDTESTAYKTAQQLKDSIQQKANESNLVLDAELNVTGVKASAQAGLQTAQEAGQISSDIDLDYDKSSMSLDQLNSKIQELNNEKVRIQTEADTSGSEETLNQLDTEISALQNQRIQVEIDTAYGSCKC